MKNVVLFGAFALFMIAACDGRSGSSANIPIDPGAGGAGGTQCGVVCDSFTPEEIVDHCDTFCSELVCDLEGVEECAVTCKNCEEAYNEGYGDGFEAASDLCDLEGKYAAGYEDGYEAGYAAGFADGVDSVVCECEDDDEHECNRDVPPGHLRKECRGRKH